MTAQRQVRGDQRYTARNPCPICDGHAGMPQGKGSRCWGFTSADGEYAHCTREEHAGQLPRGDDGTYAHRLRGACKCGATHGPAAALAPAPCPAKPRRATRAAGKSRTYPIVDAHGNLAAEHLRTELVYADDGTPAGKRYEWRRNGKPSLDGLPVADLPLYRVLDVVRDAPAEALVYVAEGEKAADALAARDLWAVGTVTGAGGCPGDDALRPLVSHPVILWPDNDDVGQAHMRRIAERLAALGCGAVRWLCWPDAPAKGDAADYFAAGELKAGLASLIGDVPPATPAPAAPPAEASPGADTEEPIAPFPIHALPAPMWQLVEEGAAAINCPPDFLAVPLLVLAGVAIGTRRALRIKRSWREYARLWAAIVAEPGDKKSPALDLVLEPFRQRQRELAQEYERELRDWQDAMKADPSSHEPEPTMRQVLTTDATLEALADLLHANPRGLLFMRDELTAWVLAMNQYKGGKGADRANWLSLWNGALTTINRRGRRKPVLLDSPFVGVTGAIPPDVLGDLTDERGREDGFIHRLLFAYPAHLPDKWTEDDVAPETLDGLRTLFAALWALPVEQDEHGADITTELTFTPEGRELWREWYESHSAEQEVPTFPTTLRGPWAKMKGYAARLALIIHVCRHACEETASRDVDGDSMAYAAELVDYFKSHARRVYARLRQTPADKQSEAILTWMQRHSVRSVTARQVVRAEVGGIQTTADARKVLQRLADDGYGTVEETKPEHGQPGLCFTLHSHPTPDEKASGQAEWAA